MRHFQNIFSVTGALLVSLVGAIIDPDTQATTARAITNSYIVVLKNDASPAVFDQHISWLKGANEQLGAPEFAGQKYKYNIGSFKGYAGEFNDLTVARIKERPEVAFIERNGIATADDCASQRINPDPSEGEWGLGRISHKSTGPWSQYVYTENKSGCVTPVFAYIVDSGILARHEEFEGRAMQIWKDQPSWADEDDCGHGTHVAGIIGGKTYGVEKSATIYGVKVLRPGFLGSCSGGWAGVIAGINFAFDHAGGNRSKSIINLSLGGTKSRAINMAVDNCITGGLTVVVSAGNDGDDACASSPASVQQAITVSATDSLDRVPDWANHGCCVDIFGPGVNVKSSYIDSTGRNNVTEILSGTSMAAPHIAGVVMSNKCLYGNDTPKKDWRQLMENAINGSITGNRCINDCCSPDLLAFNGGCAT